eukprot:scpid73033/ scgid10524/ 
MPNRTLPISWKRTRWGNFYPIGDTQPTPGIILQARGDVRQLRCCCPHRPCSSCGLHFMVGLAEQAQEILKEWKKTQVSVASASQAEFPKPCESGTVRLVHTVCKALEAHCNEQSGSHR